jgi:hypothetical protein
MPFILISNNIKQRVSIKSKLQKITDQMVARMDQMKNNQQSHVDHNHQGMRGKLTIDPIMDFMMEKNILIGR